MNQKYDRTCVGCLKDFKTSFPNTKACSNECRQAFAKKRTRNMYGIGTASVGTIAEMEVCCEMLKRGYSVFRTVSQSSFCDVVAIKGSEVMMLEVRTGYYCPSGYISYPKIIHNKISNPTHYAVFVAETNEISIIKITPEVLSKHSKIKEVELLYGKK